MKKEEIALIRKATLKDLPEILKIYLDYQKEEEKFSQTDFGRMKLDKKLILKDLKQFVLISNKIFLTAVYKHEIIGFLMGSFGKSSKMQRIEEVGHIDELYVIPKMRGQGLSSKLKDEFFKWFKKKKSGRGAVYLYVFPRNETAREAYKKWGFKTAYMVLAKEF